MISDITSEATELPLVVAIAMVFILKVIKRERLRVERGRKRGKEERDERRTWLSFC
jgi:hypothetical protein